MNYVLKSVFTICMTLSVSTAMAIDLGNVLGGGDKGEKPKEINPVEFVARVEGALKNALLAKAKFYAALGMKGKAAKYEDDAGKIGGELGLKDGIKSVSSGSADLADQMSKRKEKGEKLTAESGKTAVQGLPPFIKSVREWPKFPKAAKSLKDQLGMSGLLKLDGDIRTKVKDIFSSIGELPKLAKAQQNVGSTAFAYLSFSGIDVSKQKAEAEKEASDDLK